MSDDLRDLYQEVILDHGKRPRNLRHPASANREAQGYNPMCGDQLTVYLTVGKDGVVEDAAFQGQGCAISVASASMMTEILKGKTEAQARALFASFHALCTGEEEDDSGGGVPPLADAATLEGLEDELERLQVLAGVRQFPVRVKCATLAWHTMVAAVDGAAVISTE
ncbi:MAG: SUF system NifU family Fe-S cluster assembly protein [Alphaproteobacteria bacterium]|nr:SUF system NifU family Fe-S cluster assembly protein [Alphaproteobacteria bacterium]